MINSEPNRGIRKTIKDLEHLLDGNPNNLDAHCRIAELYIEIGDRIEAFSWYSKASKRFPTDSRPFLEMGNIYMEETKYQSAYDMYQKATELDPNNYLAWLGISNIFKNFENYDECLDACKRALKTNPEEPIILKSSVRCMVKKNQFNSAQKLIDKLYKMDLDEDTINFTRFYESLIAIKQKRFNKAISILERVPESSKYYGKALHNLALSYSDALNPKSSEDRFKKLLENDFPRFEGIQDDPIAWINYGLMYEKNKKYNEAFAAYKTANLLQDNIWPYMNRMKEIFIDKMDNANPEESTKDSKNEIETAGETKPKYVHPDLVKNIAREKLKKLKFALYLGCVIPNRYPMIEAATRIFFNDLGIQIDDMEGATCCPAPGVFRSFDIKTWLTIAARNINIAEKMDDEIVTLCNGCYGTLLEADHQLKESEEKKKLVNSHLEKAGLEYKGSSKVRHIIDIMYHDIGLENLKPFIKKKWNMDVAVHYGCHLLKPTETKPWEGEFEDPTFFDEIVELTGAHSIPYKDKMMCCGAGGGVRSAAKEVSLDFTFTKLKSMREAGAQAIITCCPFCQLQFDLGQVEVNNVFRDQIDEPFHFPVIYITQLFDYSMEKDPYNFGLLRPDQPGGTPPFVDTMPIFEKYYEIIEF